MDFKELVQEAERTGTTRKKANRHRPEHRNQANAILEYVKDSILTSAADGALSRGKTVTLAIPKNYLNGFGVVQNQTTKCCGNMLGNLREVTMHTFLVKNTEKAVSVFDALKDAAKEDGITIGDPFILATLYKHDKDIFADEEIVGQKRYHIQKKKLRAELKTDIRRTRLFFGFPYRDWQGEKAELSLALDYTYND